MGYSSQGSHTGQLDSSNWLADDSTTGHYAPPSLIMSIFLIRNETSQSSSHPIVLTRLDGPISRPNPHTCYLTQMLLAVNLRYLQAGKNSRIRMKVQGSLMQVRFI